MPSNTNLQTIALQNQKEAENYLSQGKIEEAIASYQKVIELQPEHWGIYQKLGDIYFQQGKFSEAITIYENAIKLNPNFSWFHHKLGEALMKLKQWDKAVTAYQFAIELNPDFSWSYQKLGETFIELSKWDLAATAFRQAIKLNPEFYLSYEKLGEALTNQNNLHEAVTAYQKAIEINPNSYWSHNKLGETLIRLGKLEEAEIILQKAIEINPKIYFAHHNLGEVLFKQERVTEAIAKYHQAIAINPNSYWSHNSLGNALAKQKNWSEAIAVYRRAIEINPNNFWLWNYLGNAYVQQENLSEAIPCLIKALKMRPNSYEVHQNIEYILKKQGHYEAAKLWKLQQKLPQEWLGKFFNFTEDWEVTSDSPQTNITQINIYANTKVNLLPTQTIDANFHQCFLRTKVNSAKAFVAVVPEGRGCVDLGISAIITSDNKLVRDISTGCAEIILASSELSPTYYVDGIVAFLSAKWEGNVYYHWMFDVVIRMDLLCRSGWISRIDKFVFSKCEKKFHQETLEALKIPQEKIIESRFYPHIKAQKLVVPSFTIKQGGIRSPKWGCEFIRNLFLKSDNIRQISDQLERIFISRKLASWRGIVNEDEVVSLLEKFGFISVTLESFSVTEQAALMSKVKVVIAPHGAGLTNLVFCNPGTKVIEIFSPKYINVIYWQISSLCHLSHYYLIGENFENENSDREVWKPDILVDLKKLVKIMKLAKVLLV